MLSKKDKKQFKLFSFVLNITALVLFVIAFLLKFYLLIIIGWIALLSAVYIKYCYIPKNSKKKKNSTEVTPEVSVSKYWDNFIKWLHT